MMWWKIDKKRIDKEIADIKEVCKNSNWLSDVVPKNDLDSGQISVKFNLKINGKKRPWIIIYPYFFPATLPAVKPLDGQRHSGHQWGAGGELCLQYRPDNWNENITGAMMIESAYKLLSSQSDTSGNEEPIQDDHVFSEPAYIKDYRYRALLPKEMHDLLKSIEIGKSLVCDVALTKSSVAFISDIDIEGTGDLLNSWKDSSFPSGRRKIIGFAVHIASIENIFFSNDSLNLQSIYTYIKDRPLLGGSGLPNYFVIFADETSALFVYVTGNETKPIIPYYTMDISEKDNNRLPEHYRKLENLKIGIVGCGSLGAKVAISLARSGIKKFVLIDKDIFHLENLVRNDLDGESLGMHKADALRDKINYIAFGGEIKIWKIDLLGQERSTDVDRSLRDLSECNVILDMTANPETFNLTAFVAKNCEKLIIFSEVYAGGIGGAIFRSRPGKDPNPYLIRQQYFAWCNEQKSPKFKENEIPYSAQTEDGPPLIADDSDVTAIAAHVTRMTIDGLLNEESIFPYSGYLIGLRKEWIFGEPFEVQPIIFNDKEIDNLNTHEYFSLLESKSRLKISLHKEVRKRLKEDILAGKDKEIGGWLFAERVRGNHFRIIDFSTDRESGTSKSFTRSPGYHQPFLDNFLADNDHNYKKFNYIGEWHSHPSDDYYPSKTDIESMQKIIADNNSIGFVILLVSKIENSVLKWTITLINEHNQEIIFEN